MQYPDERDITNPAPTLPPELAAELVPLVEAAQRRYRRFRQNPGDYREEPQIVINHAADVFKTLVLRELSAHSESFEEFRRKIGMEAGVADIAFRYAHYLYKTVQGGRMLAIWHRQIHDYLWGLIRDAEDLWWNPDVVPKGWEDFIPNRDDLNPQPEVPVSVRASALEVTTPGAEPETSGDQGGTTEGQNTGVRGSGEAPDRRAMVAAFIQKCLMETGAKVTKTMIWRAAGYKHRSEFERWESNRPNASRTSGKAFTRVIWMQPRDFLDLLRKRQLLR